MQNVEHSGVVLLGVLFLVEVVVAVVEVVAVVHLADVHPEVQLKSVSDCKKRIQIHEKVKVQSVPLPSDND